MPPTHHELCFGCGRTNLFGLLREVELTAPDPVKGHCFIKRDERAILVAGGLLSYLKDQRGATSSA